MKPLRNLLDKLHPSFDKGGKFEKLYPLYEALDTFLYTPGTVTKTAAHVRDGIDLKRYMVLVVIALIPCIFMAMWNTGFQANTVIRNRQVAEVLLNRNVLTSAEVGVVMQASIGRPIEDQLVDTVAALRSDDDETQADTEELKSSLEKQLDSVLSGESVNAVSLDQIKYTQDRNTWPDWQTAVMQSLGLSFEPGSFVSCLIYGALYFLPVYIVCMAVGGAWEVLFAIVRGHEVNEGFLVTGMLFPLTLPPTIPLWQVALGISFGVVIGKEIFGGTGRNFLNPALTARAFLYFAYPAYISGERIWTAPAVDSFSGATSLTILGTAPAADGMGALSVSWWQAFLGTIQGSMGETSALCCLLGAAFLIVTGVGSWKIMAGTVIGAVGLSTVFWIAGSDSNLMFVLPPWWHLVIGGFAFGAVFMATDPVSASMTETGKWWYGILIGAVTILIRVINPAFPEGVMLAILLGNVFAPLIDYFVLQANIKRRLARNAA
ncbi:NADH:ubiquinone reductase (Na(+)-transporting) subunit B [Thalassoroseus pseudoceratinae]|uniref:NADH:ubiquinone reductase (Na(+)-transporting) subunit B n=1 Tax=Thalassoroseus pseudoceratinae TaxID=2713176 RepID=UPI00141FD3BA|nr:NADH:ubiquinone reductase (Na(+)-transporting) subunit B [Thalassoroseus pseudoceratinae]